MDQKDQVKDQLLQNSLTVVDDYIEEEINLEPSLLAEYPTDILKVIFDFLDADTLLKAAQVNRNWYTIAIPFLPHRLFEYYHTQTPQALNDGYLLKTLCEVVEPLALDANRIIIDPFLSEAQQKLFFQQWMQDVFAEVVDGSESLLDFLNHMSQEFRQAGEQNEDNRADYEIRFAYLDRELSLAPTHITFLFNREHIERFLRLYDRKENFIVKDTTDADYLFLAQCLHRATQLEGFLTTLVLFWKVKRNNFSESRVTTSKSWTRLLLGDGLVALHTYFDYSLLKDIFYSLTPAQIQQYEEATRSSLKMVYQPHPPRFTPEAAQFLFQKLRPVDILNWVKLEYGKSNFYQIEELLLAHSPYLLALLSTGSLASDTALIYCFREAWQKLGKKFFNELVKIPEIISRLQMSLFLHRLLASSLFSNREKSQIAEEILTRSILAGALAESTILFLMRYFHFARLDSCYRLNDVFAILAEINKLTSSLLIKFAQFGPSYDPGKYALSILETESARTLLLQDTACATEIAKIAIDSQHKKAIISQLEDWFKFEEGEIHQNSHRPLSFHWRVLLKELTDQDLVIIPKFLSLESFFAFLDCIFSINRMTLSLFSVLMQTFPDKSWWEQNSLIHFNLKDIFIIYALSVIERSNRRQWLSKEENLSVAFAFTQCLFASDQEAGQFVKTFSPVIQQFSALQLAELWCSAQPKHKQAIQDFITLNHWMTLWIRLNRAVSVCAPRVIENKHLLEIQLIDRLTHEPSAKSLIDSLFQHHAIEQIQPWCRIYPNLLIRLQQPDIYRYVWQRCLVLLSQPYDGALPQDVLGMLKLLVFLPVPTGFSYSEQKALLNHYAPSQIYTFCLQLAQKAGAVSRALQEIFYPVCLPVLEINELQQLKQELLAQGLSRLFFPIHEVERILAKKVQQGGTGIDQGFWLDALTTRESMAGLLLLLAGTGCLIAGLVLGWMILTGVGVIPLAIGVGILLIPVGSTLWHRRIPPSQESDHTIEGAGDRWPTISLTFVPSKPVSLPTHHDAPLDASKPSPSQNTRQEQSLLGTIEFNPTL